MNIALIVAGGVGKRLGMSVPKQFLLVEHKPLLVHTLEKFNENKDVDSIIVVTLKERINEIKDYSSKYGINKLINVVEGGETRQLSVYKGLKAIKDEDSIVLIHDGARPLVSSQIIAENIKVAKEKGNAITAIEVDKLIASNNDYIDEEYSKRIQTPQTFKYKEILNAHELALKNGVTSSKDDSYLVKLSKTKLNFVRGDLNNFKVTTKEDLILFTAMVKGGRYGNSN